MRARGLLAAALLLALTPTFAAAHDARPLGVRLEERAPARWQLAVWTPPGKPRPRVEVEGCAPIGGGLLRCEDGPRAVSLRYPPPAAPALSALVQVRWHDGARFSRVLPPGEGSVDLPSASEPVEVLRSYAKLGLEHIAGGLDHLLFLLLLVFVVRTPPRALLTVTGFTVAHALTLGLAVAGVVRLPGAAVEPAIAMSIVVLALELARGRRASWTFRHPISVAFAFGLLHGFGFAGALVEAGLPRSELGPALAAFHVGVELGQLALVLLVLGLMRVLRRVERPAERVAAYATGIVATFWTFERVAALWGL